MFDFSNPTTQAMWGGFIRSALIMAGGFGLSQNQLVQVSGAVVCLIGVGWSLYAHKSQANAANTQVAVAVQAVQASSAPGAAAAVVAAHAANPGDVSAMRAAARSGTF
jgi:hypothetical protein